MGIPILNESVVYIGGDLKSSLVIGAALTLSGIDAATSRLPIAANAFFSQAFNSRLTGVAGVYTSPDPNQSGIAVFARFTPNPGSSSGTQLAQMSSRGSTPKNKGNRVQIEGLNSTQQKELLGFFYGAKKTLHPR